MKPKKQKHDHSLPEGTFKHTPDTLRQYDHKVYESTCKKMSHGSADIMKCMSWAHNENWRPNHPKSLNRQHKKKK